MIVDALGERMNVEAPIGVGPDDMDATEVVWRSLESKKHLSTPYQRFDFLRRWQATVGTREGIDDAIGQFFNIEERHEDAVMLIDDVTQWSGIGADHKAARAHGFEQ